MLPGAAGQHTVSLSLTPPRASCDALAVGGTIVIGFDDSEGADRALDRAVAEATSSGDSLVVVSVFEALLDPEGPQNFGSLNEGAHMMPLVEPATLEPIFAKARARVEAAGLEADYVWAVGNAADKIAATARDRNAAWSCWPRTTMASSHASSARMSRRRSSESSARASSSSTDAAGGKRGAMDPAATYVAQAT